MELLQNPRNMRSNPFWPFLFLLINILNFIEWKHLEVGSSVSKQGVLMTKSKIRKSPIFWVNYNQFDVAKFLLCQWTLFFGNPFIKIFGIKQLIESTSIAWFVSFTKYLPQERSIPFVPVVLLGDVLSSVQCCPCSSSAKWEFRHLCFSDSPGYRGNP